MKDHEKRELVNALTEIATQYGQAQQLRDRIAHCVLDAIERAVSAEREACAERCEQLSHIGSENQLWMRDRCVAAIRQRSNANVTGAEPVGEASELT